MQAGREDFRPSWYLKSGGSWLSSAEVTMEKFLPAKRPFLCLSTVVSDMDWLGWAGEMAFSSSVVNLQREIASRWSECVGNVQASETGRECRKQKCWIIHRLWRHVTMRWDRVLKSCWGSEHSVLWVMAFAGSPGYICLPGTSTAWASFAVWQLATREI